MDDVMVIAEQQRRLRMEALESEIGRYVARGYRVVSRTDYSAQLLRPKVFSRLWAFLWFCLAVAGILVYLGWYAAKRDSQVYLTVDEQGKVHRR